MSIFEPRTIFMFVICALMFGLGAYMVYDRIHGIAGGGSESHAELALLHLGKVSGSEHLVVVAFGVLLMFLSAKFIWKIDVRKVINRHKARAMGLTHQITDTGRKIAALMRSKDQ